MNKEEFAISEKTYENYDGLKIKIVFSNLGRKYKKIGDQLYLMLEKEELKLEDSLTAMVRITKENEEIDRKNEIEKIKIQSEEKIQKIEEIKNNKIKELEIELQRLKDIYEKQQEKNEEIRLMAEIQNYKEKLEIKTQDNLRIDTIEEEIMEEDNNSEISETYTELINKIEDTEHIENKKIVENTEVEINYDEMKETKPETSTSRTYPRQETPQYYEMPQYYNRRQDKYNTLWNKRLNKN